MVRGVGIGPPPVARRGGDRRDEIHWGRGKRADNFLTVIYQIDAHCRRLLWVGRRRSQATLRGGLKALGPEVVQGLRFVCSDMWKPYLQVIAAQAGQALHVFDRFHITGHLNQAVDEVRRAESTRLRAKSKTAAQKLKKMRWSLLRRGSRVRGHARQKLKARLRATRDCAHCEQRRLPLQLRNIRGNRADVYTMETTLRMVERKYGNARRIWVFDRGMVSEENLEAIRKRGGQYLTGTPRSQMKQFESELLKDD
jgi:hypothetical protein